MQPDHILVFEYGDHRTATLPVTAGLVASVAS